jgi:TonB family protein
MRAGGVRVVVTLGRPDPDRLSTATLWSLIAHFGLLAGVVVFQLLPSEPSKMGAPHFVTLAAPGRPAAGGGGGRAEPEPPKPKAPPPPVPKAEEPAPAPPAQPSTKASLPSEKPPKPVPQAHPREPAPVPSHETSDEPSHDEPAAEDAGGGKPGAAPGPAGSAAGEAGGVGGTSFGEGDFRFGWYQSAIESKLQSAWRRPMASGDEVQTATVSFTIMRNGTVKDVQVVATSGSSALDLSTMRAVYDAAPLPPLPRGWSGDSVHVSIEFSLKPVAP